MEEEEEGVGVETCGKGRGCFGALIGDNVCLDTGTPMSPLSPGFPVTVMGILSLLAVPLGRCGSRPLGWGVITCTHTHSYKDNFQTKLLSDKYVKEYVK